MDPTPPPEPPPEPRPPTGPPTGPPPPPASQVGWLGGYPGTAPADRIRLAVHQRDRTDYEFRFWTALGWTILTCGIYGLYVVYRFVERSRDHNRRRLELLSAATALAWERAEAAGRADELRPRFDRIAAELAELRRIDGEFRDPTIWVIICLVASGIAHIVLYILLDMDLVGHDRAEGAIEQELATVLGALGTSVPEPDPGRLKGRHAYVARVVVTIVTLGIYALWWIYDLMGETNRHYEHNHAWEDALLAAVEPR